MTDQHALANDDTAIAILVGQRIAQARKAAGFTLRALAAHLGVDHSTLAGYEAGRRPLRVTQLVRIARALGMSPAALLIEPPEATAVINQLDGNLERLLQVSYFLETLALADAPPQL